MLTPDGKRLDRFVIAGMDEPTLERIGRLPAGHGLLGLLVDEPRCSASTTSAGTRPSVGFPAGHPPMRSFLGVPVRVGDAVFGNLYLTEKRTGGPFTAGRRRDRRRRWPPSPDWRSATPGWWSRPSSGTGGGRPAPRWPPQLLSGADPDEVLRSVASASPSWPPADLCAVLAPSLDDDETLTIVAAEGEAGSDVEGVRVPVQGTYVGSTHQAGGFRLIAGHQHRCRSSAGGRRRVVELTAGYGPAMVAPVGSPPDRDLLVVLRTTGGEPFRPDDLQLFATFAARASVVLELARAQQRERQLRLQADRDRIARDLHDHVVQRIFATALSLDRLSRSLAPDEPGGRGPAVGQRRRAGRHDDRDPDGDLRAAAGGRPRALDRAPPADRRRPAGHRGPRDPPRRPVPRRGRRAAPRPDPRPGRGGARTGHQRGAARRRAPGDGHR